MIKIVIKLILLLAVPLLANAQTTVQVGETIIHIPAPPEFIEVSQLSTAAKTYGLNVAASSVSDLLGVFAPKEVGSPNTFA